MSDTCNIKMNKVIQPSNNIIDIITTNSNDNPECLICLDSKSIELNHFSIYSTNCKCNYYVHDQCLKQWIIKQENKRYLCLLCNQKISSIDNIPTRPTHPPPTPHRHNPFVLRYSRPARIRQQHDILTQIRETIETTDIQLTDEDIQAVAQISPSFYQTLVTMENIQQNRNGNRLTDAQVIARKRTAYIFLFIMIATIVGTIIYICQHHIDT